MPEAPIYTDTDCKACNRILFDLNQQLELFDQLDSIGLDTSEARLRQTDLVKQLLQWKKVFFPGR